MHGENYVWLGERKSKATTKFSDCIKNKINIYYTSLELHFCKFTLRLPDSGVTISSIVLVVHAHNHATEICFCFRLKMWRIWSDPSHSETSHTALLLLERMWEYSCSEGRGERERRGGASGTGVFLLETIWRDPALLWRQVPLFSYRTETWKDLFFGGSGYRPFLTGGDTWRYTRFVRPLIRRMAWVPHQAMTVTFIFVTTFKNVARTQKTWAFPLFSWNRLHFYSRHPVVMKINKVKSYGRQWQLVL
jgi:hypothetical protein